MVCHSAKGEDCMIHEITFLMWWMSQVLASSVTLSSYNQKRWFEPVSSIDWGFSSLLINVCKGSSGFVCSPAFLLRQHVCFQLLFLSFPWSWTGDLVLQDHSVWGWHWSVVADKALWWLGEAHEPRAGTGLTKVQCSKIQRSLLPEGNGEFFAGPCCTQKEQCLLGLVGIGSLCPDFLYSLSAPRPKSQSELLPAEKGLFCKEAREGGK